MAFTDRTKISEYDATAANNINLGAAASPAARLGEYGVDADAEAMRPSDTNGALRELMAHLKAMDAGTSVLTSPKAGQFLLEAISASITATAVDVFVYDTSKDSDGGAWRKRCQHTSWYNEPLNTATRGSRREFPAVAVIVAEASKVTIYDADDPTLPMWMVFNAGSTAYIGNNIAGRNCASTTALNAQVSVGRISDGVFNINFIKDNCVRNSVSASSIVYTNPVSERNTAGTYVVTSDNIINSTVNDVAMTVLPDAPTDSATGLPVPTIAVATDGGVSVIKDDGNVWDIGYNEATAGKDIDSVSFDGDYVTLANSQGTVIIFKSSDLNSDQQYFSGTSHQSYYSASIPPLPVTTSSADRVVSMPSGFARNGTSHLAIGAVDRSLQSGGMVAYATSTYNTGWMNGDIKGAFLSDTDDTDLVATNTISDRSVNALTLTLADAATVQAVATGAELVSYTFAGAESVTLGSDISTTGALIWWEKVSGIWQLNVNDLSGGTDYVNGVAGTVSTGLTISGTTLSFAASKEMALARATATIPTADQIAKIYEDEKFLFQDNAACTLYGASDAVTALAHDPVTGVLSVGTSAGRSDFQGLRRVNNTTTAVGTAISAVGGMIVEE